MSDVKAFRGLRYNKERAGEIKTLITPPYDVITAQMQDGYYEASPYNIIRLEWGKKYANDTEKENRYTRAATDFKNWQQEGVLERDEKPAFYLYRQIFTLGNETHTRSGFIASLRAEGYDSGNVLPHEETLPKHKADRLDLMKSTFANFSPIFGLYAEEDRRAELLLNGAARNLSPVVDVTDESGVRHMLWKIDNDVTVAAVEKLMSAQKIYIADGHHRYETASLFASMQRKSDYINGQYIMLALVNLYDEGLVVLPTHRLVKNVPSLDKNALLTKIEAEGFSVEKISGEDDSPLKELVARINAGGESIPSFGLYFPGEYYLLQAKNKAELVGKFSLDKPLCLRELDVSILHSLILEKLLSIGKKEMAEEGWLGYTRDEENAVKEVDEQKYQCAFLMGNPLVHQMLAVAQAGEKMPQKSTFFYPKIIAGLIVNKLN